MTNFSWKGKNWETKNYQSVCIWAPPLSDGTFTQAPNPRCTSGLARNITAHCTSEYFTFASDFTVEFDVDFNPFMTGAGGDNLLMVGLGRYDETTGMIDISPHPLGGTSSVITGAMLVVYEIGAIQNVDWSVRVNNVSKILSNIGKRAKYRFVYTASDRKLKAYHFTIGMWILFSTVTIDAGVNPKMKFFWGSYNTTYPTDWWIEGQDLITTGSSPILTSDVAYPHWYAHP